jgi:hypothetical protein
MTQRQINERKPFNQYNKLGDNIEFEKGDLKQIIGLVLGIASIFGLMYLYRFWAIKDYIETTAVYVDNGRSQKRFEFTLENGAKNEAWADFKPKLDIGDTVWIQYSTFNSDVIEVIDLDYKKHLKKNVQNTK